MRLVKHVALVGKRRGSYGVLAGKLRAGDHLENLGVDRRIILKRIFKRFDEGMDWINMAEDRNRFGEFVNTVMKVWFS
jgi:hypothetical protein